MHTYILHRMEYDHSHQHTHTSGAPSRKAKLCLAGWGARQCVRQCVRQCMRVCETVCETVCGAKAKRQGPLSREPFESPGLDFRCKS